MPKSERPKINNRTVMSGSDENKTENIIPHRFAQIMK